MALSWRLTPLRTPPEPAGYSPGWRQVGATPMLLPCCFRGSIHMSGSLTSVSPPGDTAQLPCCGGQEGLHSWSHETLMVGVSPQGAHTPVWSPDICCCLGTPLCCLTLVASSSGHRTGKGQFSFQSQRKAMPKNTQTTAQLHSSHTLVQ